MKHAFLVIALIVSALSNGQTEKDLYGKWQFASVEKFDGSDGEKQMMLMVIKSLSVQFDQNHVGTLFMVSRSHTGTWKFDSKTKKIHISNNGSEIMDLEILDASANELRVRRSPSLIVKMKRVDTDKLKPAVVPKTASATKEQLTGKWEMTGFISDGTPSVLPPTFAGSRMTLEQNGSFSGKLMGMVAKGNWKVASDDKATTLNFTTNADPMSFYIISVSTTTLQLQAPNQDGVVFEFTKK